ncbi:MAG: hypothetical protein U5L45_02845 [Saprospiraceae bacterium]|nr:hypothetical protein [Saprospiraceae bacterium]
MAKKSKNRDDESAQKNWREGDLINSFGLNRIKTYQTPVMQEWLDVDMPEFNVGEQYLTKTRRATQWLNCYKPF